MSVTPTAVKDSLGLQVLWPRLRQKSARIEQDIVFVHGLHSGSVSDWQNEGGPFWPVDFLGRDLENTRILSFGYRRNASAADNAMYEEDRIFIHGEALCNDLLDNWTSSGIRPWTTFIGHGTGGIVIKSALCYSHARETSFGTVLQKTRHVIFLDTPHVGLNVDAWQSLSQGILSEEGKEQWTLWSKVLSDLCKVFSEIASGFNISSAGASLKLHTNSAKDDVTPGDSGLTYLGHERVLHLDGVEHLTISKFADYQDPNYQRLLNRIRAGWKLTTNHEAQISKVRSWIGVHTASFSDPMLWNMQDRELACNKRHPETGRWLHGDSVFQRWAFHKDVEANDPRILWLTGSGGTGKTVLCSYANETIAQRDPAPATPYLYLRRNKGLHKRQMAQILAFQLLGHVAKHGGVEVNILSLLSEDPLAVENLQKLIRLLVAQCSSVYFFVDGLNEVATPSVEPSLEQRSEHQYLTDNLKFTLDFLADMTGNKTNHVRLWCSSQSTWPVVDWMQRLGATELKMNEAHVRRDVQTYLADVKVQAIQRLSDPLDKERVKWGLTFKPGSNFLWAFVMAETIRRCRMTGQLVQKVLHGLPGTLRILYDDRLKELQHLDQQDVEDGNPPLSMNILSILAYAKRPLTSRELQEALSVIFAARSQDLGADNMVRREDIIYRCKPFVDFVPSTDSNTTANAHDGYLWLSHDSMFDFLHGTPNEDVEQEHRGETPLSSTSSSSPRAKPLVDTELIADVCLKYLSQTRYSRPLRKLSPAEFETATTPTSNVRQHHFLQYAAKYWYRHLEALGSYTRHFTAVKTFLMSPQFITAIQTQSLFIVGHFINTFDVNDGIGPGYHRRRVMKKNIPDWFRDCDEASALVANYEVFFSEWSKFLQMGVTDCLNGEIERCFWGALGDENFLSRFGSQIELNKSYLLRPAAVGTATRDTQYLYETICEGGTRVSVWRLSTPENRDDSTKPSTSRVVLTRAMWYVDGRRPPFEYGPPETISFHPKSIAWDLYDPCRLRNFSLIPTAASALARAPPVADCLHGLDIRIGAVQFFRNTAGGEWMSEKRRGGLQQDETATETRPSPYWEHIVVQGPFKVRSRRVLPDGELYKSANPRYSRRSSLQMRTMGTGKAQVREDDSDGFDCPSQESSDDEGQQFLSSAEEYWTSDSFGTNMTDREEDEDGIAGVERSRSWSFSSDQDEQEPITQSDSDNGKSHASHQQEICSNSDTSEPDCKIPVSARKSKETSASDHDADDDADMESESDSNSDHSIYQPRIAQSRDGTVCDVCNMTIIGDSNASRGRHIIFYRCRLCDPRSFYDLCTDCFNKGHWCENASHQLQRMTYYKGNPVTLEILSRDRNGMRITIFVSRDSTAAGSRDRNYSEDLAEDYVFRYTFKPRDSQASLMHISGPVLHPTLPLMVYPLEGTRLLFANLETNTYLMHTIPYSEAERSLQQQGDRSHPIATVHIDMRFSPCGRYLHVARITSARFSKNPDRPRKHACVGREPRSKRMVTTARLFAHIMTIRLSSANPCSGVPRTMKPSRGIALGTWPAAAVRQLPTLLTWADKHVYVCIVDAASMLKVFRVLLDTGDDATAEQLGGWHRSIESLAESIPMPRSARDRSVYFYPAAVDDAQSCARVILGSMSGTSVGIDQAQPPAVVYLRRSPEGEKGEWRVVRDGVLSFSNGLEDGKLHMRMNDPLLENFDADSDCDLVLPLEDFQR